MQLLLIDIITIKVTVIFGEDTHNYRKGTLYTPINHTYSQHNL